MQHIPVKSNYPQVPVNTEMCVLQHTQLSNYPKPESHITLLECSDLTRATQHLLFYFYSPHVAIVKCMVLLIGLYVLPSTQDS